MDLVEVVEFVEVEMEMIEVVEEVEIHGVSAEKVEMNMEMDMEWVVIPQAVIVRFGCRDGGSGGQG
jgi:hypothetical protein